MMQFGTRSLLATTVVVAIGVPAFLFPGGICFYLPMLWLFLLALVLRVLLLNWLKTPARRPLLRQWPILAVVLLLTLSVFAFAMLFDVAFERYSTVQHNASQRRRALDIPDYEHFRDVCLELHSRLIAKSNSERAVEGSSQDLPAEIKALKPILITASDHYISIQLTRDGGMLLAYPLDGTFPHVSSRKLSRCLYYWPK